MLKHSRFRRRVKRQLQTESNGVLSDYLRALAALRIGAVSDTPIIAVDLELTGLEVESDEIIAMGWTCIDRGRIQIGSNRHVLVQARQSVGQSATIHELVDSEITEGIDLEQGLEQLFDAAQGRVWLFHHATLDHGFLQAACQRFYQQRLPMVVLDTLQIERRIRLARDQAVKTGELQLSRLREYYALPPYDAHNALIDALATAELFQAMAARLSPGSPLQLKRYIRYL